MDIMIGLLLVWVFAVLVYNQMRPLGLVSRLWVSVRYALLLASALSVLYSVELLASGGYFMN